jgi:DUF1009 family protein
MGRFKEIVTNEKIEQIVMLGYVRRPSMMEVKPDWLGIKVITKIGLNLLGDDALLQNVGSVLHNETGVEVIAAQDVFANFLTPSGILSRVAPNENAMADIKRGITIARTVGSLDVGQAVVVQQGIVLGVEAIEGTDALITRTAPLMRTGPKPTLIKMAKPQQDHRYDLPSIGLGTIRTLAAHNFAGVAIEAGKSLSIQRDEMIKLSDEAGLFVIGINADA